MTNVAMIGLGFGAEFIPIYAHESAMKGGEIVRLPDFTLTA